MGVRQLPAAPGQLTLYAPAGLRGAEICLAFPSVGATETLLLAAATAQGQTVLHGAAKEPEIADLAAFLNACGGCVEGAGTDTIRVQGKRCLAGCTFTPVADRIIASTLACAAAAAGGIVAEPLDAGHIAAILREEKLIPVAQLAAFKDPISPRTDPSMAIHYNGSALWLDARKNGNPWLNPYSTAAVEYVGDLVEEVQQLGFEQVVLTNVQFPKLSKKQDYGTTNGVSRADQLKADIAALQDRLSGKVTLWFSYTLDQCKNSSVALDVPALTLGVQNLLVTSDAAMDADALQALETAATDAGVESLTVHAADRFETDRVSG